MGVDYDGVGGIGFRIDDFLDKLLIDAEFSRLWEDDKYEACEYLCKDVDHACYMEAGSGGYGGQYRFYVCIVSTTLGDVNARAESFCDQFNKRWGLNLKPDELKIIEDIHIW